MTTVNYFLSTVEGNESRVCPFGFVMEYEIATATKDGKWTRMSG